VGKQKNMAFLPCWFFRAHIHIILLPFISYKSPKPATATVELEKLIKKSTAHFTQFTLCGGETSTQNEK